jgi:hypothetical protein
VALRGLMNDFNLKQTDRYDSYAIQYRIKHVEFPTAPAPRGFHDVIESVSQCGHDRALTPEADIST